MARDFVRDAALLSSSEELSVVDVGLSVVPGSRNVLPRHVLSGMSPRGVEPGSICLYRPVGEVVGIPRLPAGDETGSSLFLCSFSVTVWTRLGADFSLFGHCSRKIADLS